MDGMALPVQVLEPRLSHSVCSRQSLKPLAPATESENLPAAVLSAN